MNRGRAAAERPTPGLRGIPGWLRRTISDKGRPRTLVFGERNGCLDVFSDAMGPHGFDRATATAECPSFSVERRARLSSIFCTIKAVPKSNTAAW